MSSALVPYLAESGRPDPGGDGGGSASRVGKARGTVGNSTRRERLVAVFLRDVCGMESSGESREVGAELVRGLTEAIETLICIRLGHPRIGTGDQAISEGACCRARANGGDLRRLSELLPGRSGLVQFLLPRPGHRLDQLAPLGIVPGRRILVRRLRPAVVIDVGETTLALDRKIADDIFVCRS